MRFLALVMLMILTSGPGAAAERISLTVDQAVARGIEVNPQIEAYRLAIVEAEEEIKQSRSAFLPTLSADYGYRRLINNGGSERDTDYLSQDSNTLQVRLTQPLFSGFAATAGYRKAQTSRDYREYEFVYMQRQLVMKIRSSFYEYLWAQARVAKWKESVARLERQQAIVAAWVEQELAPRLRLLELATELAHARQQQVSAHTSLAGADADLRAWLDLPGTQHINLVGELPTAPVALAASIDEYLQQAQAQRVEFKLAETGIEMAREERTIIRSRKLPRATMEAGWTDYNRDFRTSGLPKDERDYYTLSVNLSFRPFQGGAVYYADRRQQVMISRLGYELNNQRNMISAEIRTLYERLSEGQSRLKSAEQGIAAAQEAYQFAEQATLIGTASLDDLLNAELRLTRAELDKIDAQHQQQQTYIQFEYATGNSDSHLYLR